MPGEPLSVTLDALVNWMYAMSVCPVSCGVRDADCATRAMFSAGVLPNGAVPSASVIATDALVDGSVVAAVMPEVDTGAIVVEAVVLVVTVCDDGVAVGATLGAVGATLGTGEVDTPPPPHAANTPLRSKQPSAQLSRRITIPTVSPPWFYTKRRTSSRR